MSKNVNPHVSKIFDTFLPAKAVLIRVQYSKTRDQTNKGDNSNTAPT